MKLRVMRSRDHQGVLSFFVVSLAAACAEPRTFEPPPASDVTPAIAQRQKLAASGRYLAALSINGPVVPASTPEEMLASLDIAGLNETVISLTSPDPEAALVRTNLGKIKPRKGGSFLVLSTGKSGNDAINAEPGTDLGAIGADGDIVTLRFQVTVPPGRNRMSFDYTFLSAEAPEFVGSQFNDTFTARVSDGFGANRVVASATVNLAAFHLASDTTVGQSPFMLYTDNFAGVNTEFNVGGMLVDAGTTEFQRVDVQVSSGPVIIEFDVRDLGDGILDTAVIIDNLAFSAVELVDPHRDMVDDFGQIFRVPDPRLVDRGSPVHSVAADGATQLVVRSNVGGAGRATFSIVGGSSEDGRLSLSSTTPVWTDSVVVDAQLINGQWYAIALYRSPPDFRRSAVPGDDAAKDRSASIRIAFVPTLGTSFTEDIPIGVVRPPVIVVPDIWSTCLSWQEHGSILDPHPELNPGSSVTHPFTVTCADYRSTAAKSLDTFENRSAVAATIDQAFDLLRGTGVGVTRADVVGHGMGGLLARRYVDEFGFISKDNFNAGKINRIITMDTPHLGSRLVDEIISFRTFTKGRDPDAWTHMKQDILSVNGVNIDDADGDVAIDEMMTSSPKINNIGKNTFPPRTTFYHAMFSTGGRSILRGDALGLLPSGAKALYAQMEANHPKTFGKAPPIKQRLIYGSQSFIFCNDAQATEEDQHDLATTTVEQQGGLANPFTSAATTEATNLFSGRYLVFVDKPHSERLVQLLNSPVVGGPFAPSIAPPETLTRVNHCPVTLPLTERGSVTRALAQTTIAISSPAPGTTTTPGSTVSVTFRIEGGAPPQAILLVSAGNAIILEEPPFDTSLVVPLQSVDALSLRAVAFFDDGAMSFAQPVDLRINIPASITAIEVLNGDAVLQRPGRTRQLTVIGTYSDGVRREITQAQGTAYALTSLEAVASVSATGQVTAVGPGKATLAVRSGTTVSSINVTVGAPACGDEVIDPGEECDDGNLNLGDGCDSSCQIENRAPVAVCNSPTVCNGAGVCFADVTNLGAGSFDPDNDPLVITQSPAGPYAVGQHAVSVNVSDGALDAQCVSQLDVLDCDKPSLNCPADFTVECTGNGGAAIVPPSAVATDNCSATVHAPAGGQRPLGGNPFTYTASDPSGNTAACVTTATIVDTLPPTITCPAPVVAECTSPAGAVVTPGAATSLDVCTSVTVTRPAPGVFPRGTTALSYTSSDTTGHQASCSSTIDVVDSVPPLVTVEEPPPLWPPNHAYREVSLDDCHIEVADACSGTLDPSTSHAAITCVTSDEPDNAPGGGDDGHTTNDIVILDETRVKLRVERNGHGDGRVYNVHFRVQDEAGNRRDGTCSFVVPHDLGDCHPHHTGQCHQHHPDRHCRVGDDGTANSVCRE